MPYTAQELIIWEQGYNKGYEMGQAVAGVASKLTRAGYEPKSRKPKRKLSDCVCSSDLGSKKPRFKYKSGAKRGRVNLKALGVAYRKKKRR
jgi:hypothetical protein